MYNPLISSVWCGKYIHYNKLEPLPQTNNCRKSFDLVLELEIYKAPLQVREKVNFPPWSYDMHYQVCPQVEGEFHQQLPSMNICACQHQNLLQ